MLHGVERSDLESRRDDRGAFTEIHRTSWQPGSPMRQTNLSFSRAGVLRGMHFHRRQADQWVLLDGRAFVALFDLRAGSPTEGRADQLELDASATYPALFLPPGVAHGFCALTDMHLLYLVSEEFSGEDEFGFSWQDPDLPVTWPIDRPIVSARDASAPRLADVLADPPSAQV